MRAQVVPKAEIEQKAVSEPFVVKIKRPCGEKAPSFEIYDEGGLLLAYPFDSEEGRALQRLLGPEGETYHDALLLHGGQLGFDGTPKEGLTW